MGYALDCFSKTHRRYKQECDQFFSVPTVHTNTHLAAEFRECLKNHQAAVNSAPMIAQYHISKLPSGHGLLHIKKRGRRRYNHQLRDVERQWSHANASGGHGQGQGLGSYFSFSVGFIHTLVQQPNERCQVYSHGDNSYNIQDESSFSGLEGTRNRNEVESLTETCEKWGLPTKLCLK